VISQRLGHATIAITMDTYSHVIPGLDEQAAETVARLILGDGEAIADLSANDLWSPASGRLCQVSRGLGKTGAGRVVVDVAGDGG
jgi:hypothetical protein